MPIDNVGDGTLVVYHGDRDMFKKDLCFVRVRSYYTGKYLLDVICYIGDEADTDRGELTIDTYGAIWVDRDEFTVVPIPDLPEPAMEPGNYLDGNMAYRRNKEGSWALWDPDHGAWGYVSAYSDALMRTKDVVYIG
jgi:hypothetical protein